MSLDIGGEHHPSSNTIH